MNMADPQTLADFVQWARTQYAATYTVLSIFDHGGGWSPTVQVAGGGSAAQMRVPSLDAYRLAGGTGLCWDLHTGTGDAGYMSTAGTRAALDKATGASPLDILTYDANLMGLLEEAAGLAPYVHFLIASENEAWASGAYSGFLTAVGSGIKPADLATAAVSAYEGSLQGSWYSGLPFTLSALDLSYMDAVSDTFGTLADALLAGVGDATLRAQVYSAYSATQKFDADTDLVLEPERESYLDLYDLALNLAATVTDTAVAGAANDLLAAWDAGLVLTEAHRSGTAWLNDTYWDLDEAHGLAVYLPLGEELTLVLTDTGGLYDELPTRELYGPEEAPNAGWCDFIDAFVANEWGLPGVQALPARPVTYVSGPRPGLLPLRKGYTYLPLILRHEE